MHFDGPKMPVLPAFGHTAPKSPVQAASPLFSANTADTVSIRFAGRVAANQVERDAQAFVRKYSRGLEKVLDTSSQARWNSYNQGATYVDSETGKPNQQLVAETEAEYIDFMNNPEALAEATALWEQRDQITSRSLQRQLDVLIQGYDGGFKYGSMSPEKRKKLGEQEAILVGAQNRFAPTVDGEKLSKMEVFQLLEKSDDAEQVKKAWLANTGVGQSPVDPENPDSPKLVDQTIALVKARNELARENGFDNFFDMELAKGNVDPAMLDRLMDEMDDATREPYARLLDTLDGVAAERFGIRREDARLPWFMAGNSSRLFDFDPKKFLDGRDPVDLIERTANLMGDTVQPLVEKSVYDRNGETRSSIYYDPKKDSGKVQHWFCFSMKPPKEVRIFGSVDPEHKVMMDNTVRAMMHEGLGHGLDYKQINERLPYLLRRHHSITTESNAMLIEGLVRDSNWYEQVLGMSAEEAAATEAQGKPFYQANALTSMRKMMQTIAFEREMYRNPDQDLDKLWWELQEKYSGAKKPDEELPAGTGWNAIPHYLSHPVYYRNYFLAEIRRAQVAEYIRENVGDNPGNNTMLSKEAGEYLRTYRATGKMYEWDDLVERMTGKPLGVEAIKKELEGFEVPA